MFRHQPKVYGNSVKLRYSMWFCKILLSDNQVIMMIGFGYLINRLKGTLYGAVGF